MSRRVIYPGWYVLAQLDANSNRIAAKCEKPSFRLLTASYKLDKKNLANSNILSIGQDLRDDPTAFVLLQSMLT